jgi:hypothetical protein
VPTGGVFIALIVRLGLLLAFALIDHRQLVGHRPPTGDGDHLASRLTPAGIYAFSIGGSAEVSLRCLSEARPLNRASIFSGIATFIPSPPTKWPMPTSDPVDKSEKCRPTRHLGLWKNSGVEKFRWGRRCYWYGEGIMFVPENSVHSGSLHWPRTRDRLKCSTCTDAMVAPEASVLESDGNVSYLWSCDTCGQSLVTQASTLIFFNRPHRA